jgi:thioredoxin reductase
VAPRLLVIGAGPVGLSAAIGGLGRGLDVTVLERHEVGASLLRWGETRFFSPFGMNVPRSFREALGPVAPAEDELLTGRELVERVLRPIAAGPLASRVLEGHRVVAVGRTGFLRGDFAGHPIRAERGFRALVEGPSGERTFEAEAVLDASGVYGQPCAFGKGGLPAAGERALGGDVVRHLDGVSPARFAGRRVLLVGHGHSAANALLALSGGGVEVVWAVRTANRLPCAGVARDPLPERSRVVDGANALASEPPAWLTVHRRAHVESVERRGGRIHVALSGQRQADVDAVLSFTGYRPDLSFLSELALDISPATEGSGRLARALSNVTDCLNVPAVPAEALASGEPGFALAGSKSYGRSSSFLLKTGLEQLETILGSLPA